jgi:histidyl-tRNA synthetase
MRILDCKICRPKEKWSDTPVMINHLCDDCSTHFSRLKSALDIFHIPFVVDPFIVRGLDYYTKTAFEIVANTGGSQNAVAGGGRYDNLVRDLGGQPTPATGFAVGLERLFDLIPDDFFRYQPLAVAYTLTAEGVEQLVHFAKHMSHHPVKMIVDYKPRKMKKALQRANRFGAKWIFIIGEDEVKNETIVLKDLEKGEQTTYHQYEISTIVQMLISFQKNS